LQIPIFKDIIPENITTEMEISCKGYEFIKSTIQLKPSDKNIQLLASEIGTKVRVTSDKKSPVTRIIIR
jgi:hypothetical protein